MVEQSIAAVPSEEHAPLNASTEEENINMECDDEDYEEPTTIWSSRNVILSKCLLAGVFLYAALLQYSGQATAAVAAASASRNMSESMEEGHPRRRLTAVLGETIPSYMKTLNEDLEARKKLFADTPPEEVKYWFEYTGPLQVSTKEIARTLVCAVWEV